LRIEALSVIKTSVTSIHKPLRIVSVLRKGTRRNLRHVSVAKRGESNFVLAFGRAYLRHFGKLNRGTSFLPAREFQVSGFGVADFVWFVWQSKIRKQEGSALEYRSRLRMGESLLAFEMKLRDWRKALGQAYRYRYFADAAYVVLPPQAAEIAKQHLSVFQKLCVGLWSFDKDSDTIRKIYTPRRAKPLSEKARERAVATLERFVKARRVP
jgi:hypothetical protein